MNERNAPMVQRDIRTVTAEIRTITETAKVMALNAIVEIGRRLKEAKTMLPHGEWGRWLETEVEFKQSTANNYMRIFEEYSADQMTLDGAVANSQTLGKLSYSKALALLALPSEEEREAFAAQHNVEAMSSRELKAALDELKKVKAQQQRAEEAAAERKGEAEKLKEQLREAQRELDAQRDWAAEAERRAKEAEQVISGEQKNEAQKAAEGRADEAERQARAAQAIKDAAVKEREAAEEQVRKLEEALRKAKENQNVPKELREALIAEGREAMAEEIQTAENKLAAAQQAEQAARLELEKARADAEQLRKDMMKAVPGVETFKVRFEAVQADFRKMEEALATVREGSPETAEKLRNAVGALLAALMKRIEGEKM